MPLLPFLAPVPRLPRRSSPTVLLRSTHAAHLPIFRYPLPLARSAQWQARITYDYRPSPCRNDCHKSGNPSKANWKTSRRCLLPRSVPGKLPTPVGDASRRCESGGCVACTSCPCERFSRRGMKRGTLTAYRWSTPHISTRMRYGRMIRPYSASMLNVWHVWPNIVQRSIRFPRGNKPRNGHV